MTVCQWCHREFAPLVPGTRLCGHLCRAIENAFRLSESKGKRDPFLTSLEARGEALKHERHWRR
jgi:hypothetical protein